MIKREWGDLGMLCSWVPPDDKRLHVTVRPLPSELAMEEHWICNYAALGDGCLILDVDLEHEKVFPLQHVISFSVIEVEEEASDDS